MRQFRAGVDEMLGSMWRSRELLWALANREILGRYRGSVIGVLWSFFNPLLMLAVYTFVFGEVFKSPWGAGSGSKSEFALVLFLGLIVFNLFAECVNRAPLLMSSNANYVKKVVFPLEILPGTLLLSALFHAAISLGVWLAAYMVFFGVPHLTALYLPLILLPYLLFILGISWVLGSVGVYLRDLSQLITITTTILMFLSPIFYPIAAVPENYRFALYFNPLALVIEQVREVMFWGHAPDIMKISIYWVLATGSAWAGFFFFQKTRRGFADVL